jgi:hypothetical protein
MGTPIRTIADLAEHLDATDATPDMIGRRLYKDTSCGAWFKYDPPLNESYGSVLVGTIVEGSDVEPIVSPRRLYFPFDADLFDKAIEDLEEDADACWKHINECEDWCDGSLCGYSDHVGGFEVKLNEPPVNTDEDEVDP